MKKIYQFILVLGVTCILFSCKKFLDAKPDESLAIPSTAKDLQALMDNFSVMNQSEPTANEGSADDYQLADADFNAITNPDFQRIYTWEKENLYEGSSNDWYNQYRLIYFCNTVVTTARKISPSPELNNALGQAHYYRAKCFFNLAQLYTKGFSADAVNDLGLPLRLDPDFNQTSVRASNNETYQQIVNDVASAIKYLPNEQITKYRPTKRAAYGLMARAYLTMGNFELANKYADSCLSLNHQLLDYNILNASVNYPIPMLNVEVLAQQTIPSTTPITQGRVKVPAVVYNIYQANDLRKAVFFKINTDGTYSFKGSYEGELANFGGIAVDEIYLISAETNIRLGKVNLGLSYLNALLVKRYKTGTFTPYQSLDDQTAISLVLNERRKELLMRGLRWTDIKRLNVLGANINLSRTVNGKIYTLPANSLRYALPIPESVLALSGMPQNPY